MALTPHPFTPCCESVSSHSTDVVARAKEQHEVVLRAAVSGDYQFTTNAMQVMNQVHGQALKAATGTTDAAAWLAVRLVEVYQQAAYNAWRTLYNATYPEAN